MKNLIQSFFAVSALSIIMEISPYSLYLVLMLLVTCFIFEKIKTDEERGVTFGSISFGALAILRTFQVNVYESTLQSCSLIIKIIKLVIIFIGIYFLSKKILSAIYHFFDNLHISKKGKIKLLVFFLICFAILVVLYLPVWLMEYPSNISPDTISQIWQIQNGSYANHHPFAHTMWLKLLMMFSSDLNTSIGIAAFIQMVLNATVFSYVIKKIYEKTENILISLCVLAFYGLCSFHAFYSITLIKDVTHATITVLMLTMFYNYHCELNWKKKWIYLLLLGLSALAFCLFRTNGYYAFVFTTLFSVIYAFRYKDWKLPISFIVVVILASVIKGPIYTLLGIGRASFAEALSVPLQQIALVIKNGYTVTEEELQMLNQIMDVSKIPESYNEFLSDPIKNLLNSGNIAYLEANKAKYLKLWIEIGLRHPVVYIRAWLNQFSGYISTQYYSTSFFWTVWQNNLGIEASPILTGELNDVLHNLAYYQNKIPVFGILHYPAVYTWTMIIMMFYSIRRKDIFSFLCYMPLLGILLTLMISCPYNLCFRYYYAVVCCLPLMLFIPLNNKRV